MLQQRKPGLLSPWNVLRHAMRPGALPVMLGKLRRRIRDEHGMLDAEANMRWIQANVSDVHEWGMARDASLFEESLGFAKEFDIHARKVLTTVPHRLAGGGHHVLLYFLVRLLKPVNIVETGVAAGYSSAALLAGAEANGLGRVYSSDFPAFRLPKPEQFIGILVTDELRQRWELRTDGDESNLQQFMRQLTSVDLVHYDSDKSYSGRTMAMGMLRPRLSPRSVVVMDDIQDNSFFHDWLVRERISDYWIFEYHGKYLGIAGRRLRLEPCP